MGKNHIIKYDNGSFIGFIIRQYNQIKRQGWAAIYRKCSNLFLIVLEFPLIILALLFVIIVRLLRPITFVRIGSIDVGRIGGVYQGDWFLSEKKIGKHQKGYFDWFYFERSTSHVNKQWEQMWKDALPYLPGIRLWKYWEYFNRLLPDYKYYRLPIQKVYLDRNSWLTYIRNPESSNIKKYNERLNDVLSNIKPNINFNNIQINHGKSLLNNLKIPKDKQYICFHARDGVYLDSVGSTDMDWSYHNFRDSDIQNYILAAEEMVDRGYSAIRMGAKVKDKINSKNPSIIDYAVSELRTDSNDIFLGSHCRFFLCSDCGISVIPEMFRVPTVYVNWTLLLNISTWVINGLFIFKKFYKKEDSRLLSFTEILALDFGGPDTINIFTKLGLELIENTPEEIRAVTIEMDERIKGTWKPSPEDNELQNKFWSLFGPDKLRSHDLRIGAEFLRQNKELLC